MKVMKNVSDYVTDEEELVAFIYDVSFPKWVYDEIPKLESEFLKQIWYFWTRPVAAQFEREIN